MVVIYTLFKLKSFTYLFIASITGFKFKNIIKNISADAVSDINIENSGFVLCKITQIETEIKAIPIIEKINFNIG